MRSIVLGLILVLILTIGTVLPLFHSGFFEFHDNTQVARVSQMGLMLSEKVFPVRWVPDLGYGYGYPIFNFYAPLPYYIGGVFNLIGFDALSSTKIMFGIGSILSAITMFFFSKKFFGIPGGMLSAVMYAYFPYHAVNIYVRGAVGEYYAYAFLPIIFLGIYQLIVTKKQNFLHSKVLLMSFGIFLVAVSHNLTFLLLMLLLFAALILGMVVSLSKRMFVTFSLVSIILGIGMASFYLLPAFFEMNYTNVSSQIGGGADFADHFVCLSQFWNSQWGFGGSIPGCIDGLSFKLGKVNVLFVLVALGLLIYNIYKKKIGFEEKIVVISFALLLVSIFLTLEASKIFWESIPYLEYVQYPWRIINFIALFVSFIAGYAIFKIEKFSKKWLYATTFFAIFITIVLNIRLFTPQKYVNYDNNYYTNKNYIRFTVSKISDEYLPKGFQKPSSLEELPAGNAYLENGGELLVENPKSTFFNIQFKTSKENTLHINKAYFPSWEATLNGKKLHISSTPTGMEMELPKGEGKVLLSWNNTSLQSFGNIISVIAASVLFAVIIFLSRMKKKYHGK